MALTVTLEIPNISCHHCTGTIIRETKDLPGVLSVEADVDTKTATFRLEDASAIGAIKQTLIEIGYPPAEAAGSRA